MLTNPVVVCSFIMLVVIRVALPHINVFRDYQIVWKKFRILWGRHGRQFDTPFWYHRQIHGNIDIVASSLIYPRFHVHPIHPQNKVNEWGECERHEEMKRESSKNKIRLDNHLVAKKDAEECAHCQFILYFFWDNFHFCAGAFIAASCG